MITEHAVNRGPVKIQDPIDDTNCYRIEIVIGIAIGIPTSITTPISGMAHPSLPG